MKLLTSILVASLFLLIGLLKSKGYLYMDEIYLFGIKDMGKTDISWFIAFLQNLLFIPTLIDSQFSDFILKFLNNYFIINYNEIFLGIVFSFYFVFLYLLIYILSKFSYKKDKYTLIISIIILYLLLIYYLKYFLN